MIDYILLIIRYLLICLLIKVSKTITYIDKKRGGRP